jgi:hypothetical protein
VGKVAAARGRTRVARGGRSGRAVGALDRAAARASGGLRSARQRGRAGRGLPAPGAVLPPGQSAPDTSGDPLDRAVVRAVPGGRAPLTRGGERRVPRMAILCRLRPLVLQYITPELTNEVRFVKLDGQHVSRWRPLHSDLPDYGTLSPFTGDAGTGRRLAEGRHRGNWAGYAAPVPRAPSNVTHRCAPEAPVFRLSVSGREMRALA